MRLFPTVSFRQLLLAAFILIVVVLGVVSLRGLVEIGHLLAQNRGEESGAVQLSANVQRLAERSVMLERIARQYLVLDEPALRSRFDTTAKEADALLVSLSAVIRPSDVQNWKGNLRITKQALDSQGDTNARQQRITTAFRQLDVINSGMAEQVRASMRAQNERLLAALETGRHRLAQRLLGSFALTLVLAVAMGFWLGRPLKQLERAVVHIGENRLDQPVVISGPADLHSLGRRLDWLRLRLVELDADKARFLRHVSHELKTPLASIREGVALLDEGVAEPLQPKQREIVHILSQQTALMQEQIEDLLRFNTVAFEARRLQPAKTRLQDLIRQQIDSQRLHWQAHQLQVSVDGMDVQIEIDPDKLGTVIGNLLSNAIRFSPAGGHIRFAITHAAEVLRIDVTDQGPGVDMADNELIFQPFYRGHQQPQHEAKGSGIGLSIVREYVQAHGGRVVLVCPSAGAHFRIELPYDLVS